jgi:LacI family transcriptional regulator
MSARQALTNLVGRKLLYRIAGKGTFVCSQNPDIENTILGLVLNNFENPFFPQLAKMIQSKALDANYDVMYYANDNLVDEAKSINTIVKRRVAGAILVPSQYSGEESLIERLEKANIPFVYLNRLLKKPESDYVITDNAKGVSDAMEYLCSLGHRKIGFVAASPYTTTIAERLECYNNFVKQRGLDYASVQISSRMNDEGGYEGGMIHLSSSNSPTALFCGNDITAVGVMKAAREMKVKVPKELSVMGYDDIELAAHLSPALTTVSQLTEKMAATAIDILISRLNGGWQHERSQIIMPPSLAIRESCSKI